MARAHKKKRLKPRVIFWAVITTAGLLIAWRFLAAYSIPVLQPAGPVAAGERRLLIIAFLLMLLVVLPVLGLTFGIAWRYRESNKAATYRPNFDHSRLFETIWWLIPTGLIGIIAVMAWQASHKYDPYKSIAADSKTMTIQVVALDWRWLFIYPNQQVASINDVHFPVNTPVKFEITADAPMNSFWIPQLAGQIYAMPGMNTQLHVLADRTGTFYGSSANISGKGFANMHFTATATSKADFAAWVKRSSSMPELTGIAYQSLATASTDTNTYLFSHPMNNLYSKVIQHYMPQDSGRYMEGM